MSEINDGGDEPLGMQTDDGELEVREVDGVRGFHETELGQHQRWLRQAPDLFELYQGLLEGRPDHDRLVAQAIEISKLLSDAGIPACSLPEGVRMLIEQRDQAVPPPVTEPQP